ncbi:hypothetical protein FH972_005363 [Carpinus fangiana]|uniref:Uncharacterized protein n=1 Tax=Carpinus fangiana TaxID=176857 RepID=A0A5N6QRX7_9ROSI|nr:hypothetical protein FH972_005363 [Carpinus fangiana]
MADTRGRGDVVSCDDRCGCAVPCPGGETCRCTSTGVTASGAEHKTCGCGEHCGCNPCTCPNRVSGSTTGRSSCQCGLSCTCTTCKPNQEI